MLHYNISQNIVLTQFVKIMILTLMTFSFIKDLKTINVQYICAINTIYTFEMPIISK